MSTAQVLGDHVSMGVPCSHGGSRAAIYPSKHSGVLLARVGPGHARGDSMEKAARESLRSAPPNDSAVRSHRVDRGGYPLLTWSLG